MRKFLCSLLAIIMIVSLCACGNSNNNQSTEPQSPVESTPSTEETVDATEPSAEQTKPITEPTQPTEPEETHIYNVLNTEVLSPKFTYASNSNSAGGTCGGLEENVDTSIYVIAIRVIADAEYKCSDDIVIPSLTDDQYYIAERTYSYLWHGGDYGDVVTEANLLDTVYVIEYTTAEDKDVWVETCTGEKIINLSEVTYDKEVKTSGDVNMYECAMIEDEYGTKQYVIPIGASADYCNVGLSANDIERGWFNFDLIQLGNCENIPTDLSYVNQFYWHPEVSIEYDGFKYYTEATTDDNSIYIPSSSTDDFEQIRRDVNRFEFTIEFRTKNPELLKDNSVMYLNFEDVRFCFDILEWQ